ncbi:MAG: hypothetical protein GY847_00215 [Proteobacteria bacterium]|nr:hypothetical protein [Pseudomonadota bacterium]
MISIFFTNDHESKLARWSLLPNSPESVLEKFYEYEGAEDQLMDPLILGGDEVVPLVIEKVKDQSMPGRRYAIGFLGNQRIKEALSVLENIAEDPQEVFYIRFDAVEAAYAIDKVVGAKLAEKVFAEREEWKDKDPGAYQASSLEKMTKHEYEAPIERRTWKQALYGYHY